jgi:dihydropteroate synthase
MNEAGKFRSLGLPLLFGHSRKSFLQNGELKKNNQELDVLTANYSVLLANSTIDYLRVHNIKENIFALSSFI